MAEIKIAAEVRNSFGKGASRQARRDNLVPGVVYGHGAEPLHITLPAHQLMMALKTSNALLSLQVDGRTELVIPKAIQRNAIRRNITHVDLLSVKLGEKVTVDVNVHTEGELAPGGNLMENVLNTLSVETEATHIPSSVTVSIAGLEAGATIHAKDVPLPEGTTLVTDPEAVVIQILAPKEEAVAETADETPAA